MKYVVELLCGGFKNRWGRWVRSYQYPLDYTYTEAHNIIWTPTALTYRLRPADEKVLALPVKPVKPYRRHAAVTQLELRGAIAMLRGARQYIIDMGYTWEPSKDTSAILFDAKLACKRQLEAM